MKRKWFALFLIVVLAGCTSIPKESVSLNQEVGKRITAIHQSNTKLVNMYFQGKKNEIDEKAEKAVETFFKSIVDQVDSGKAPPLNVDALQKIKKKVMDYYAMSTNYKRQLEKSRVLVIDRLNADYMETVQGNSTITGLLQSHVEMEKATESGLQAILDISGAKIDLNQMKEVIDKGVKKAGEFSEEAVEIYEEIEKQLKDWGNPQS